MKNLVIYDSMYGNTEKLAVAVAKEIRGKAIKIGEVKTEEVMGAKLLVVGSPTQGGRPTAAISLFLLNKLPYNGLQNTSAAVFDTRMAVDEHGAFLKFLMKIIGFAAGKLATTLKDRGAKMVGTAEGFIVEGKEGPLKKGELERAVKWAKELVVKNI
jgi:flavorubredoxin